ncbi:kinesin light chain protein [Colletotrichum musicola]|uniref:Kinesin light chain protein n=1 Tax=Colletotrichum musicola TaxID=2175873 RepID=A0A8H6U8R2_9PEZI|nr:kinesin light chain protein [Colletotrichum musicola]
MLLRAALATLKGTYEMKGHQLVDDVNKNLDKIKKRSKYRQPAPASDRLYKSFIVHPSISPYGCDVECGNDAACLISRHKRDEEDDDPAIHYGLIASGNQLMKDARIRDTLAAERDVLCFEMEAAGLMNHFPCLVIRGIYDYSDSHKNKEWQGYAAMMAAAYAKDLLHQIAPNSIEAEKPIREIREVLSSNLKLSKLEDPLIARNPHFVVPFPSDPDFVNRSDIWIWIEERYVGPESRFALVGMGGFGVFWVYGGTKATFEESYRSIVDVLALPRRHDPDVDVLVLVRDWLQREDVSPWLMVIDNADDIQMLFSECNSEKPITSYLPKRENSKILITSRNSDVAERLTGNIKMIYTVPTMENEQALQLLQKKLGWDVNEAAASRLSRTLDCIPLAVNQPLLDKEPLEERNWLEWGKLLTNVSWYLVMLGNYSKAEVIVQQAMSTRAEILGQEHPSTLTSMANLASTFWNQGRWKEAEELVVRVMETGKRVLGEEHPHTLTSMANLASTYRNQGRWKEAEELDVRVMEMNKRVLGEEHPSTLASMANLASTYRNQGRWKEAEELNVRVMETRKRVLGEEHPSTLTSMANLASTFWNQGRWKDAEELNVRVMETRKKVLGEEHPSTLRSMANLALTYSNQGRWKEAEKLEVRVMETRKRVLGEEHPDTLISIDNLASTYRDQGRWRESEELQLQLIEVWRRALGEEHPSTLTSIGNLASTYSNQGRWKEAEELEVRVMEMNKRVLGEEHPSTLTSMGNLASIFWNQGRWKEAEELEVQVMETSSTVLGEEHPSTLTSMGNLASTFWNQGRWKEAEELFVRVMETKKRVLGEEHPHTLTSMGNLASTYSNQGRWKEAEELEVWVMETRRRVLGEEHPDTLASMNNLAHTWMDQGLSQDAISLLQNCVALATRRLGSDHPKTLGARRSLDVAYMKVPPNRWAHNGYDSDSGYVNACAFMLNLGRGANVRTGASNALLAWLVSGSAKGGKSPAGFCLALRAIASLVTLTVEICGDDAGAREDTTIAEGQPQPTEWLLSNLTKQPTTILRTSCCRQQDWLQPPTTGCSTLE